MTEVAGVNGVLKICVDGNDRELGAGGGGGDFNAIHDNQSGEIAAIEEKVTPVNADLVIIEDSADSNAKKKVQVGNLPGGGGGNAFTTINTSSGTSPVADSPTDTLNLTASTGMLVVGASATDTVTFVVNNVPVSALDDATDGELITWDSSGAPTTVPAGTVGHVLTSAGAGAEPTFQVLPFEINWLALSRTDGSATFDKRGEAGANHYVLEFSASSVLDAIFTGKLNASYGGNGLTFTLQMTQVSTSGNTDWHVFIERMNSGFNIDLASFATAQTTLNTTVPGTSGDTQEIDITFTNAQIDGLLAGEYFRVKVERDSTTDTATGTSELIQLTMKETV